MGKRMKKAPWIVLGALLLVAGGTGMYTVGRHLVRTSPSVARKAHAPLPVQAVAAERASFTEVTGASGVVEPIALVKLTVDSGARVEEVAVDVGDMVTPDQTLVRFDRDLLAAAQKTALAAFEQAKGERGRAGRNLERIEAVYRQGFSDAVMKTAQAAFAQARGERERAGRNLERIEAIHEQGLLPKVEVEQAQAEEQKATARLKAAEEELLRARKDLQTELERAQAGVEEANVRFSEAEERLLRTQRALADATLCSPVVGIVMDRQINPGEVVQGLAQKILEIGRIDEVAVATKIAEEQVGGVQLNQPASVTFNAFPNDTFVGKVVKIKPVADPTTRTFLVYVRVGNPELKLKPGLTGFVRVQMEHEALAIPSLALINPNGPTGGPGSAVFVVEQGKRVRLAKVRTGAAAEGMTEIVDGLAAGDEVVTVGQFHLRDGDLVRIGDEFTEIGAKLAKN